MMRRFFILTYILIFGSNWSAAQTLQQRDCCDSVRNAPKKKVIRTYVAPKPSLPDQDIIVNTEVVLQASDSSRCCDHSSKSNESGFNYEIIVDGLWLLFWIVVFFVFYPYAKVLCIHINNRVKHGAGIKFASFELSSREISHSKTNNTTTTGGMVKKITEDVDVLAQVRKDIYQYQNNALLVHTILKSNKPNQAYDLVIYVIPRLGYSLIGLTSVDYYFGEKWGGEAYRSIDRANGFAVVTSAYGPFLCAARLNFNDKSVITHRYIDFEMGDVAPMAPSPNDQKK